MGLSKGAGYLIESVATEKIQTVKVDFYRFCPVIMQEEVLAIA